MNQKLRQAITTPMRTILAVRACFDYCENVEDVNQVIKKIQEIMLAKLNYGPASAMAWIYFSIVMAIIGLTSLILSKVVYYYD